MQKKLFQSGHRRRLDLWTCPYMGWVKYKFLHGWQQWYPAIYAPTDSVFCTDWKLIWHSFFFFFFFVPYLRNVYRVHFTCSITLLSVLSFPCNYVMSMSMGLKNSGYLKGVFSVSIVSFFEDYLTHSVSQYLTVFICYVYRFWFNFCYNSYCQFSLDLLFCVEWSGEM